MIEFERYKLNNGLTVILHHDPTTPMAVVNTLYDVGARDENEQKTGFAHLFEHLMFGGSINVEDFDQELQKAGEQNTSVDFITHRGDRLLELAEISTPDIAFLRHQNYWNDKPVWTRIFDQALERLNDDGLLVITSYFDKEHELATEALKNLGAIQVGSIINPNSRALSDAPGKSVDKHLAIFQKK